MIAALETENIAGEIINLGTSRTHEMKDVLDLIRKAADAEGKEVVVDEGRLRLKDVEVLVADNKKAKRLLGWRPETAFEEGIRKTIASYDDEGRVWGYEKRGWPWRY